MIYYRDPLLDKICDRILDLAEPAFIKNSELVFVAVNEAFASLFNLTIGDLVGTSGDHAELVALMDIEDKERACLVFGDDQMASFADPFGKGRFQIEMERFTLADGQTFLYCIFETPRSASVGSAEPAPRFSGIAAVPEAPAVAPAGDAQDEEESEQAAGDRYADEADLYRELLNRLPVATFVRGADHRLAVVNQAYAELFGRDAEDLIGTDEDELFGEAAGEIAEANRDTLINGTEYEQEQEIPAAGGRVASTIVRTGRLTTKNGKPHVIGTIVDISAIRQRELQLKSANEQAEAIRQDFENIVASVDVGLIVLDQDQTILLVNEAYRKRIWGRGAERWKGELVGHSFRELLRNNYDAGRRPQMFDDFESYYESRVAELRSGVIEKREVVFDDGTVTLYSGIKLSGGKFLLCYVDLTELRKRDHDVDLAHREAAHAYQLVRSATDAMSEGLMMVENGRVVLTNRSLAKLLNVSEELLEPERPWEDIFVATCWQNPDADEEMVRYNLSRFREALESGKDVSYNFPLDGERWVHVDLRHKDDGQSVIICSDLTEVLRREEQLRRLIAKAEAADRAKSEFLANMSLEIRTPMSGILGMAELLAKSALDTHQKAFIDIIMKSGNALLTIINDILDFSRLDAGHMQLKYASFDPCEALEDVASLFAAKAAEKDVELIVKRTGSIPAMIMGDAGRFRQILSNLISNAVKFTEQGHVTANIGALSDSHGQTILNLTIEDTGIGIPADKLDTIFEKFSRVEVSSNRREGTGLGLAIAQRLASLQGGVISVHSSEGRGSTFSFTLPVQVAAETSRQKPLPVNVEGARILVVDDHDVIRNHLLESAEEWGFECAGAADADTGLSILAAAAENGLDVDAVVIDSQMPGVSGAEMVRRIRASSRFAKLPVILLTPQDLSSCGDMVADAKVEAYLTKPIRIPLFRDTLIDVIRAARTRQIAGARDGSVEPAPSPRDVDFGAAAAGRNDGVAVIREPARHYVLIAEDNEVNQIFFSQIMDAVGLNYRIVENGRAALEAWQEERPSVIVMDSAMPVLDGFEATRRIREIEAVTGGHTPIIGVISHAQDDGPELCIAAGMDDHISKPVSPERLEEKIRHWSGRELQSLLTAAHHG